MWTIQITTTRKMQPHTHTKSIYKHLHFFLFTNNENKNSKHTGTKFNKHSNAKDSPEHDFICQSGSYAGLLWSHSQTCTFSFVRGREFQTDDPENAKLILYRSMRVRGKTAFWLISSRRSVKKVAYILRRPTHMDSKHKHSVLYTNCSCSGRMSNFLSFAVVDSEWSGNISLAYRLWS